MILLLPNQLFPEKFLPENDITLFEHPKFFTDKKFHKQKLLLHKASMQAYQEKYETNYVKLDSNIEAIFEENNTLTIFDPVDHEILDEFQSYSRDHNVDLKVLESPNFLTSRKYNRDYFRDNKIFQLSYYKEIRKKKDILMTENGPKGGKWSFDPENRKTMPQNIETPKIPKYSNKYVENSKNWVNKNFPDNPGSLDNFFWPTTRNEAIEMLEDFLEKRIENFGRYQDAFEKDLEFGFHSLISSSMNVGLLNPQEVVDKTLESHKEQNYPMNSLEGFLRQIIGWREFIRAMYELNPEMAGKNFFNAKNSMPEEYYTGETGLPPVDYSIQHAKDNAYCHHIERLMVLGNSMLLLEINPDGVYDWFMEMFIDSYEWVMVPNIYGMSQYAWPEMMTKPYISSSNYINKMSHYSGGKWENHWDGLYWDFIRKHEDKIADIPRMSFMTSTLNRMEEGKVKTHVENAEEFKQKLKLS